MEMTIHGYEDGSGFNATIPWVTPAMWRSRFPMNAWELRQWVSKHPAQLVFSGDVAAAKWALNIQESAGRCPMCGGTNCKNPHDGRY
jgi:hypothetical protein